jgi:hypothetical protein
MNRTISAVLALAAISAFAACSGSGSPYVPILGADDSDGGARDGTARPGDDDDDDEPHALGTIVLGESHLAGSSDTAPLVSATFLPDAQLARACGKPLDGCTLSLAPKCTRDCGVDELCSWSDTCSAVCKKIPLCDESCDDDEQCVLDPAKPGASARCEPQAHFDAGPIAFSGTTTPITLYPPYAYQSDGKGAPFLAGSELRVQAQGASGAGFEAFDETFTATRFLQTTPTLDKLSREQVFGTGPLPTSWVPGDDTVVITLTGEGGSATCKADDASGSFAVPRSVVDAVRASDSGVPSGHLSLTVARQRKEIKKGKKAKGPLPNVRVIPAARLELVTTSVESASYQGCFASSVACGDDCVDLKNDRNHCGACGKACPGTQSCSNGKCGATCELGPENTLERCSDGCSNDGDIYIDCDDYDCCKVRTDCPANTACGKQ